MGKSRNEPTTTNQAIEKRSKQTVSQRITTSFPDIRKFTYPTTNKLENELETGEFEKISGLLLAFFVLG